MHDLRDRARQVRSRLQEIGELLLNVSLAEDHISLRSVNESDELTKVESL